MTPAELEARLDPVASWSPDRLWTRSDFDLNPGATPDPAPPRPAAVLIALTPGLAGLDLILTRRADGLARHTGQIALPGGRLDPGETAVEAALREAWEEVALPSDRVRVLGLADAYRTGTGYLVTPVVGWVDDLPPLRPEPAEVAEIFTVPWAFLMDPANHRRDHYELDGVRRHFWTIDWQGRAVWGATAGMLIGLHDRLTAAASDRVGAR